MREPRETFGDFVDQTVRVGDRVVYPGLRGHELWLKVATVLKIERDPQRGWQITVRVDGGKRDSILIYPRRMVKVPS